MNKIIRNAIVYKADLPASHLLEKHLEEKQFVELGPLDSSRMGFVPVPQGFDYVEAFDGGIAFAVRLDEKILPASVVKQEVAKRCKLREQDAGYKPGRKERKEIEEMVVQELRAVALIRSKAITCYYDTTNRYLIIPVASKTIAGMITSKLVKAVGSIKTETINISDVKMGLTTRLTEWVVGNKKVFGDNLEVGDVVNLERVAESKEKISCSLDNLETAEDGLSEAFTKGFNVTALGMVHGMMGFRLTSDFHFKAISFGYEFEPEGDAYEDWKREAAIQLLELSSTVSSLCDLLSYKEEAQS